MQRDNTAHAASDAAANESRESPLNRLLRKPAAEAPAVKPASAPTVSAAPAPQAAPAAAKPVEALSPSDVIANKLRGLQAPRPLPRPEQPRVPAVVPEVTVAAEPV